MRILFVVSSRRAIPSGALRKNHRWEIPHLAGSIRDVGAAGRRESVAEARRRCGFGEGEPVPWSEIHG